MTTAKNRQEDEQILQWINNPVVPSWLQPVYDSYSQEAPNTLHYDETTQKIVLTIPGENTVVTYDNLQQAHDDRETFNRKNTKLIGEFPDVEHDELFTYVKVENASRILFFETAEKDRQIFLYRLYRQVQLEQQYLQNPEDFYNAYTFISSHMINWTFDRTTYGDLHDELNQKLRSDTKRMKKYPVFTATPKDRRWAIDLTFYDKTHYALDKDDSLSEKTITDKAETLEKATINIAQHIYDSYTWTGELR